MLRQPILGTIHRDGPSCHLNETLAVALFSIR
jgi:hypothetical protein